MSKKVNFNYETVERLLIIYWTRYLRLKKQNLITAAYYWQGKYDGLVFLFWKIRPNGEKCSPRIDC